MAKDVIITPLDGDIQFKNASSVDSGRIEQLGDDLVITNAVGDVLIGDGSSDLYVGDGINSVDIVFDVNGSIRGETGVTLTLGASGSTTAIAGLSLGTETNAVMRNTTTGALSYRTLGSNAFNSTNYVTAVTAGSGLTGGGTGGSLTLSHSDTSTLSGTYGSTSDGTKIDSITVDAFGHVTAVATGAVGDILGVTAGTGLSGGGTSGTVTLNVSGLTTSEFSAATLLTSAETFSSSDTILMTSAAIESYVTGFGYTTNVGDITGVTAGSGLSGGGTSGTVTLSHSDTSSQASVNNSNGTVIQDVTLDTYGHVTALGSVNLDGRYYTETEVNTLLAGKDNYQNWIIADDATATTLQIGSGDTLNIVGGTGITSVLSGNTLTITATNNGDITGVTAGSGLSGGGTSGTVTLSHSDTSSQASVNNSSGTVIQDVTLDTYGHVTALGSVNLDGRYYTETEVNTLLAGKDNYSSWNISDATTTTAVSSGNTVTVAGGTGINAVLSGTTLTISATNNGDITGVTAGTGLSGGGSSGTVTLNLDFSELTDMTADVSGTTELILQNGTTESRKAIGEIKLSAFNNDAGFTSNVGDITGVTAGTGISGGGTSGTVTVTHGSTSTLEGTYGSTADGTKIDQITVDAFGHVTAITTGNTGDILGVTAGTGLTGGGTSGTVTLNVSGLTTSEISAGTLLTSAETFTSSDTVLMTSAAIESYVTGFGYTTNVGDITGVTAGSGISGGGTSGTVTVSHADTSSQASVNNSGGTVIQDVTLDTYGHVTGLVSYNLDGRYYTETESDGRYLRSDTADTATGLIQFNAGIKFGSTGETLNSYEEGSFTPVYGSSVSSVDTVVYDTNVTYGRYTRIGNVVVCWGRIRTDFLEWSGTTGAVYIGGFPFTPSAILSTGTNTFAGTMGYVSNFNGDDPWFVSLASNQDRAYLYYKTSFSGTSVNINPADLQDGGDRNDIAFQITYRTG